MKSVDVLQVILERVPHESPYSRQTEDPSSSAYSKNCMRFSTPSIICEHSFSSA